MQEKGTYDLILEVSITEKDEGNKVPRRGHKLQPNYFQSFVTTTALSFLVQKVKLYMNNNFVDALEPRWSQISAVSAFSLTKRAFQPRP